MNASEYQKLAARTLSKPKQDLLSISREQYLLLLGAMGLAGEAGETLDAVKKIVFHAHPIDLGLLKREIGDTLWYAAALCTVLDIDLTDVMQKNIDKLKTRYPNGFTSADSLRRRDQEDP